MRRRDFADARSKGRLTNRFFPKDRCTLPNQMSFLLVHSWSAFVLAKGDRHGANKNEIVIFVFSVTTKGFSHARAPGWKRGDPLRVGSLASALGRQSGFPNAAISKASFARAGPNCLQVLKSVLAGTLQESVLKCRRALGGREAVRDRARGANHRRRRHSRL